MKPYVTLLALTPNKQETNTIAAINMAMNNFSRRTKSQITLMLIAMPKKEEAYYFHQEILYCSHLQTFVSATGTNAFHTGKGSTRRDFLVWYKEKKKRKKKFILFINNSDF